MNKLADHMIGSKQGIALDAHSAELVDLTSYLDGQSKVSDQARSREFENEIQLLRRFRRIDRETRILEIGTGAGWFQVLCLQTGINCRGIEISPQLIKHATELGRRFGVTPNITHGNVETLELGQSQYDVVVATSVFEHVPHWQTALRKLFDALKPGGVLYFCSTNKFSFKSGEYPQIPFYGWFPDKIRYWLRVRLQGPDVMKFNVDFNQFTYPQLRRFLEQLGFCEIYDFVDMQDPAHLSGWSAKGKMLLKGMKKISLIKHLFLSFCEATVFVCRK